MLRRPARVGKSAQRARGRSQITPDGRLPRLQCNRASCGMQPAKPYLNSRSQLAYWHRANGQFLDYHDLFHATLYQQLFMTSVHF